MRLLRRLSTCSLTLCRLAFCGLLGCCLAASALAGPEDKPQAKPAAGASEDAMMAEYMKMASPGPNHERLKQFAGSWKTVTKGFMAPGEPQVSEGTAEASMILDGRYLREDVNSTWMGAPFHGFGLTGYDNMKQTYVGTWADTMGTGLLATTGTADPSGKVLTSTATYTDPVTKQSSVMKMVNKVVDANKHILSIYDVRDGKETLTMEITYTRK